MHAGGGDFIYYIYLLRIGCYVWYVVECSSEVLVQGEHIPRVPQLRGRNTLTSRGIRNTLSSRWTGILATLRCNKD